jgi:cell division protein FtsB
MGDIEGIIAILGVFGPLLIVAFGITYYQVKKGLATLTNDETQKQMENLNHRVSTLEGRINDLQDILITVDEKLKRAGDG